MRVQSHQQQREVVSFSPFAKDILKVRAIVLVDICSVDFRKISVLGGFCGIILWEPHFKLEQRTALEGTSRARFKEHVQMSRIP